MLVLMKVDLEPAYIYILFYSLNISYFYLLSAALTFAFDKGRNQRAKGVLMAAGLILAYILVKFIMNYFVDAPAVAFNVYARGFRKNMPLIFFRAFHFTMLAIFVWASGHIARYRRMADQAEQQRLQLRADKAEVENALMAVQNAYLRQQINPHLLFNALNFTYSRVVDTSPEAARCLILLTGLLRFSLDSTGEDGLVNINDELKEISHLLEINRFRFGDNMHLEMETEGDFENYRIIPLILLTLTENVFKHGNLTNSSSPALIRISITREGELNFFSSNAIKSIPTGRLSKSTGLRNARIRLENTYSAAGFNLCTQTDQDIFTVRLSIRLSGSLVRH
ncbi:sensor histidine kinase [Mucilaginibacter conchicola]|nr:histidine kinase [Mucilaginibacter conchicola]